MIAKCREIQKMLPSFVGDDLRPEAARGVAEHLAGCVECRTMANDYHQSVNLVKSALGEGAMPSAPAQPHGDWDTPALPVDFFKEMREAVIRKIVKEGIGCSERNNSFSHSQSRFFKAAAAILIFVFGAAIGSHFPLTDTLYPVAVKLNQLRVNASSSEDQSVQSGAGDLSRFSYAPKELAELHLTLGEIYIRNCRYDDAIRQAKLALLSDPTLAAACNITGAAYAKQNRYFEALSEFQRAISLNRRYATAHFNIGVVFEALGRRHRAKAAFHQALEFNRELIPAYYRLGLLAEGTAQFAAAIRYYEKALQLNPENPVILNRLGVMYMNTEGKISDAIAVFERAIALNPRDQYPSGDSAHYNLGRAYDRLSRQDEAIKEFELAIKLGPNFAPAYYSLGRLLIKEERAEKGREYIETFQKLRDLALAQVEAKNRYEGAIQSMREGRYEEANRKLKEVIKILPGYSQGKSLLEYTPGYKLACASFSST